MSNHTSSNVMDMFNPVKTSKLNVCEQSPVDSESKVDSLALAIQTKKADIHAATADLKKMESELISICGHVDDGSSKFNTEHFEIITSTTARRKITDLKTLLGLAPDVLREKFELDTRKFKKLATDNPMLYQKAVDCIETKISTPSIKITPVGE